MRRDDVQNKGMSVRQLRVLHENALMDKTGNK